MFTRFVIIVLIFMPRFTCAIHEYIGSNSLVDPKSTEMESTGHAKEKRDGCCKASSMAAKGCEAAKCALGSLGPLGNQMAAQMRTLIAEKAVLAANAAEAALVGQNNVVNEVKCRVKLGECSVNERCASVSQSQNVLNSAKVTAQQAIANHKILCQAVQLACLLEKNANCAMEKAKFFLQQQMHMLAEDKARLHHLREKLQCACAECEAAKGAAKCACEAAKCAVGRARKKRNLLTAIKVEAKTQSTEVSVK